MDMFAYELSNTLIGLVEKRKQLEPVYFLSKLSKSLIGPVKKRNDNGSRFVYRCTYVCAL